MSVLDQFWDKKRVLKPLLMIYNLQILMILDCQKCCKYFVFWGIFSSFYWDFDVPKNKKTCVLLSFVELQKSIKNVKKCAKREGTKNGLENRTLSRQINLSSEPKNHRKSRFFALFDANQIYFL